MRQHMPQQSRHSIGPYGTQDAVVEKSDVGIIVLLGAGQRAGLPLRRRSFRDHDEDPITEGRTDALVALPVDLNTRVFEDVRSASLSAIDRNGKTAGVQTDCNGPSCVLFFVVRPCPCCDQRQCRSQNFHRGLSSTSAGRKRVPTTRVMHLLSSAIVGIEMVTAK